MQNAVFPSSAVSPQLLMAEAATVYAVAAQRLSQFHSLVLLRRAASHGLTALLFIVSIAGLFEIGHLLAEGAAPAARPQIAAAAPTIGSSTVKTPAHSLAAGLARSVPTRLQIPAINLDAQIDTVSLNDDGSLQVPYRDDAGWYTGSPTPGEVGPAIIDGHVDSVYGIAVFWYLKNLKPGDKIIVSRTDGSTVNFTVEKTASYDQHTFPTKQVYGNINYPGLRLITCDGTFDYAARHYSNNLVVYARITQ